MHLLRTYKKYPVFPDLVFLKVHDIKAGSFGEPYQRIERMAVRPLDVRVVRSFEGTYVIGDVFLFGLEDMGYGVFFEHEFYQFLNIEIV